MKTPEKMKTINGNNLINEDKYKKRHRAFSEGL